MIWLLWQDWHGSPSHLLPAALWGRDVSGQTRGLLFTSAASWELPSTVQLRKGSPGSVCVQFLHLGACVYVLGLHVPVSAYVCAWECVCMSMHVCLLELLGSLGVAVAVNFGVLKLAL